jgi:RNA binding exosome subunit
LYSSIEISILIHATESENKILKSILEFIDLSIDAVQIKHIKTEGHWKNPIIRLIISINFEVDKIFNKLHKQLIEIYGEDDINEYVKTNTDRKEYFFTRLDKQKLCNGIIMLSDRDSVRMVFKKLGKFES